MNLTEAEEHNSFNHRKRLRWLHMITEQKARHHPGTLPILGPEDLELTTSSHPLCSNKKNQKPKNKKAEKKKKT